jgi:deoxyribodipyrimidine photolyase-like uncharacterized protein
MNDQNFGGRMNSSNTVPMEGTIVDVDSTDEAIIDVEPLERISMNEPLAHETSNTMDDTSLAALFNLEESEQFRTRWSEIQGKFVDEPRSAVQQADALVSEVIEKITQMFANEHGSLESQWNQGNNVSTEELRMALKHYRSFFNRLILKNEE